MYNYFSGIIFLLIVSLILSCGESDISTDREIKIGALLSLTGDWADLGLTSKAALETAVVEINQRLEDDDSGIRISLIIVDTKLDPDIALSEAENLISQGIEIIIGPQSSAELAKIAPLLNSSEAVAISMGSTSGSLSINGDHLLRFCPDDKPEGVAISQWMMNKNIRNVLAISREDEGNLSLAQSMTSPFTMSGGTIIQSLVYPANEAISPDLIVQINDLLGQQSNLVETGIYLAGFGEIAEIFDLASDNSTLKSVLWFGSNGSALTSDVLADLQASEFANGVEFISPIYALSSENEDEWGPLAESIEQSTGQLPSAYTFSAYDAIQVAALVYESIGESYDFDELLESYFSISANYLGLTGSTKLNAAGDRQFGNFVFLGICPDGLFYEWKEVGSYDTSSEELSLGTCD